MLLFIGTFCCGLHLIDGLFESSISIWLLGIRYWSFPIFLSLLSTLINIDPFVLLAFCCSWLLQSSWLSRFMHLLVWGSCVVIMSLKSRTLSLVFQHFIYHSPWFLVLGNCGPVAVFLYLLFLCCVLHFCWCDCGPGFPFHFLNPLLMFCKFPGKLFLLVLMFPDCLEGMLATAADAELAAALVWTCSSGHSALPLCSQ